MSSAQPALSTAWEPLRQPLFRALWIAAVTSNIGTWMQEVAAAWLMTSLTESPILVALLQTALSLPFFLLALPAGALADMIDRRRMLLFTQLWMLAAAAVLGLLTIAGITTPWVLLALTFALGLGTAMNMPVWQAIVPEVVPRPSLPAAVALNGVGINLGRAVGPALGGLIVAALGPGAVFLLNAASFIGVIIVLYGWRRTPPENTFPKERVFNAVRSGMRYVQYAPALRVVLVRIGLFVVCGSALWALLPLVARRQLGLDATGYGLLMGSLGLGAVVGALLLPQVRRSVSLDRLVAGATLLFATVTVMLATQRSILLLSAVMIVGGAAWITLISSFNTAAQMAVPAWVRARALAVYLLIFQGGMAGGSLLWGAVAARAGVSLALTGAALGLVVGLAAALRYRLESGEALDLAPSLHWSDPVTAIDLRPEQGPVLVTVEYHIDPQQAPAFTAALAELGRVRRRDGAFRWEVFCDVANPRRYIELFFVDSWAEHLRQHTRMTNADRAIETRVRSFHLGDDAPTVSHLVAPRADAARKM